MDLRHTYLPILDFVQKGTSLMQRVASSVRYTDNVQGMCASLPFFSFDGITPPKTANDASNLGKSNRPLVSIKRRFVTNRRLPSRLEIKFTTSKILLCRVRLAWMKTRRLRLRFGMFPFATAFNSRPKSSFHFGQFAFT